MNKNEKKILAVIIAMQRSGTPRRHLKQALHDVGMESTANALNSLLDRHADMTDVEKAEIETLVQAQIAEAPDRAKLSPDELEHDEWIIGEAAGQDRTYIIYTATDFPFIGEIFDDLADCPAGYETALLDEGQVLSNIVWQDGGHPPAEHRARIFRDARAAMRLYDARLAI